MDALSVGRVADLAPQKAVELEHVLEACRDAVSREDFALCRARIAALHGDETDAAAAAATVLGEERVAALERWWASDAFTARERALLGFVEQFVFDVSSMTDEHVEALLATDDPVHVHELANVVWAIDLVTRMRVVSRSVLP